MNKKNLLLLVLASVGLVMAPSCAHLNDTCDTYCIRHGGQCAGVEYGTRRYNATTGDFKDKPTYFHCKFIN